jgi:hypothetical protein
MDRVNVERNSFRLFRVAREFATRSTGGTERNEFRSTSGGDRLGDNGTAIFDMIPRSFRS